MKRLVFVGAEHHEQRATGTDGSFQRLDEPSGAPLDRADSPHARVDHHDVVLADAERAKLRDELIDGPRQGHVEPSSNTMMVGGVTRKSL